MKKHAIKKTVAAYIFGFFAIVFTQSATFAGSITDISFPTVTIDDVEIFYRETGEPDQPAVLLLHGFPTSSHMFRDLFDNRHRAWQKHLRENQPPTLIVWGKNDEIFPAVGAEPHNPDLQDLEYYLINTAHCALETQGQEIVDLMRYFLNRKVDCNPLAASQSYCLRGRTRCGHTFSGTRIITHRFADITFTDSAKFAREQYVSRARNERLQRNFRRNDRWDPNGKSIAEHRGMDADHA